MAVVSVGVAIRETKGVVKRQIVGFAKRMRTRLAVRTPYRTGRARAGWNLSADGPDFEETHDFSGGASLPRGEANRAGNVDVGGYQLGGTLFISNGVPYIGILNSGSSQQAPANFIETTIREFLEDPNIKIDIE